MNSRSIMLLAVATLTAPSSHRAPKYTRIHALSPREGVFAYARISPDGKRLVYASEIDASRPSGNGYTEVVVDLEKDSVIFTESGIDAYFSPEGNRIIYSGGGGVSVRNLATGNVVRNREAGGLGDYYSWATRDGRDLILTINSNYYYLRGDSALLPHSKVSTCPAIGGTGERPLISKDGRRITTFVKGNVVVRGLDNCDDIFDTGIQGAKADFSWDGRYIAFHAVKANNKGYEIKIVDVEKRTVRTLALEGNVLFPSWTRDGRLCFRYDGPDYRGFMMASEVLDAPAEPLPSPAPLPSSRRFGEIFPGKPSGGLQMVMIWAPWSVHSRDAFSWLAEARKRLPNVSIMAAPDPASAESDVSRQLADFGAGIERIPITTRGLLLTEARNQMPTTLLFRDGVLVGQKLGAQTADQLQAWIDTAGRR